MDSTEGVDDGAVFEDIAMDMGPPYISSTLRHVPGPRDKIVFDPYHIMSYMNEAVDDLRKREHREYRARGDETLARSRYLWLYAQERLPQKHQERFEQLRAMNLKTGRAWAIKRAFGSYGRSPLARKGAQLEDPDRQEGSLRIPQLRQLKTAICGGLRLYPVTHAKPG